MSIRSLHKDRAIHKVSADREPSRLAAGGKRKDVSGKLRPLVPSWVMRPGTGRGPKAPEREPSRLAAGGSGGRVRKPSIPSCHRGCCDRGPVAVQRPRTASRPGSQRIRPEIAHMRIWKSFPSRCRGALGRAAVRLKPAPTARGCTLHKGSQCENLRSACSVR